MSFWLGRLLRKKAKKAEKTTQGTYYVINGRPVFCQLCHQAIQYAPIKIPLGPPKPVKEEDGGVWTKDGKPLTLETTYGRFHITCALRWLSESKATDLELQLPKKKVEENESDPG